MTTKRSAMKEGDQLYHDRATKSLFLSFQMTIFPEKIAYSIAELLARVARNSRDWVQGTENTHFQIAYDTL